MRIHVVLKKLSRSWKLDRNIGTGIVLRYRQFEVVAKRPMHIADPLIDIGPTPADNKSIALR